MLLRKLELRNFRNHENFKHSFENEITVITGLNGVGKTSILESIGLLGSGKSFRPGKSEDLIKKNTSSSLIKGLVNRDGLEDEIEVRIFPEGKKILINDKFIRSNTSLLPILPCVIFSPSDHSLIEGDSQDRKKFIDRAASNIDWEYANVLSRYQKALTQRNRLLKDSESQSKANLIEPWDIQLIEYGSDLIRRRAKFCEEISPFVEREYRKISPSNDTFCLSYLCFGEEEKISTKSEQKIEDIFRTKLKDSMRRERILGTTQVGPHKDEILLTLNANKVKFYGSQGEKRTSALALRLGELALYRDKVKRKPILLFDDVSSELDSFRRQSLVSLLREEHVQVLITATEVPSGLLCEANKSFAHIELLIS